MIIKFLKPLSFLPALLLMYMIFSFSAQDGVTSSQLSYKVTYKAIEMGSSMLDANLDPGEIDQLAVRFNGVVRKIAHVTEYFALAVAVSFPLYVYGLRGILLMLFAGFICVAFACGDEYHQTYSEGRTPAVRDVLIDSFGIFWGILLVRIVGWTGRKTVFRPFTRKKKKAAEQAPAYGQEAPPSVYPPGSVPYQGWGQPPYPQQQNGFPSGGAYPQPPYYSQGGPYPQPPEGYRQGPPPQGSYSSVPPGAFYSGTGGPGYYGGQAPYPQPPYGQQPGSYPQQPYGGQPHDSDSLSEDMSFKKLIHDLKEQKKETKKPPKPPAGGNAIGTEEKKRVKSVKPDPAPQESGSSEGSQRKGARRPRIEEVNLDDEET